MKKQIAYLGLDVHKKTITLALFVGQSKEAELTREIRNNLKDLIKIVKSFHEKYSLRTCYEAGGCGFRIYRKLLDLGIDCIVVAPSLIPREGKKLKTDKIDATKLAKYLRAGLLSAINVPDENLERDRDLIRFREFQVRALVRIKQSILAFLLRKGINFEEGGYFSKLFLDWAYKLELPAADKMVLTKQLNHYSYQQKLVDELSDDIEKLAMTDFYKARVDILIGFRGIRVLTAMKILTHIPDFRAFPHPKKLMSYFGITSDERSSGEKQVQTGISKRGNSLLRKSIVIAAQSYTRTFTQTAENRRIRQKLPSEIIDVIQRADNRCWKRFLRLTSAGKHTNVAKVSVARELVGFIWEAMMHYYNGELAEA